MLEDKIRDKMFFKGMLKKETENLYVSFVNPFSYSILEKNNKIHECIDYFFIDGNLLRLCYNFSNRHLGKKVDRVSFDFSSIAGDVFDYCINNDLKIAFVGATKDELKGAVDNLMVKYPALNISYCRNGFFASEEEISLCVEEIKNFGVDVLVVGMGTPYQEKFLSVFRGRVKDVKIAFTCGGFLTQTSIKTDYYYPIVKKLNLMWLQRFIMHKHVRNRLLRIYPKFVFNYFVKYLKNRGKYKASDLYP